MRSSVKPHYGGTAAALADRKMLLLAVDEKSRVMLLRDVKHLALRRCRPDHRTGSRLRTCNLHGAGEATQVTGLEYFLQTPDQLSS
jgi:hypothetical protein